MHCLLGKFGNVFVYTRYTAPNHVKTTLHILAAELWFPFRRRRRVTLNNPGRQLCNSSQTEEDNIYPPRQKEWENRKNRQRFFSRILNTHEHHRLILVIGSFGKKEKEVFFFFFWNFLCELIGSPRLSWLCEHCTRGSRKRTLPASVMRLCLERKRRE